MSSTQQFSRSLGHPTCNISFNTNIAPHPSTIAPFFVSSFYRRSMLDTSYTVVVLFFSGV